LKRFFREFAKKLATDGLIGGKLIGIDGTKIRANNAGNNCFNSKRINAKIEKIEKKIAEYIAEVDKNDEIDGLADEREKLLAIKGRIEKGEAEISATDADSRMMRMPNGGKNVCHNVQSAVDAKHKLIASFEVRSNKNDQGLLHEVAAGVKENLGVETITAVADTGYYDADELGKCHKDGIETLVSPLEPRKNSELFTKNAFVYDERTDCYACPANKKLTRATTSNDIVQ
jgi:hypothetical protein